MNNTQTIVLVEDDETLVTVYAYILTQAGYKVHSGTNGHEGLELIKKHSPDAVLVDLHMPEMNGAHMIVEMRKHDWGKQPVIMVLSNVGKPETDFDFESYNVAEIITKVDVNPEQLLAKVAEHLDHAA